MVIGGPGWREDGGGRKRAALDPVPAQGAAAGGWAGSDEAQWLALCGAGRCQRVYSSRLFFRSRLGCPWNPAGFSILSSPRFCASQSRCRT